jgi:choline kinase
LVDREVQAHRHLLKARTLFNPEFAQLDNLGSAWCASDEMDQDFVILNGDTLFTASVAAHLCAAEPAEVRVTVSQKPHYDEDDMKVKLRSGRLTAVGKRLAGDGVNGESIGMILFRGQGPALFREAVCQAMADPDASRHRYYLAVINDLAQSQPLDFFMANRNDWCEVDFPEDLEAARRCLSRWRPNVEGGLVPISVGSAVSEKVRQRRGMERNVRPKTASYSPNYAPALAQTALATS